MIEEVVQAPRKPRARLKRKPIKTDKQKKFAARKRKLQKERELWESFGLIRPQKPRYVGLQGIAWYLASNAVRRQEFVLYGGLCGDGCGGVVENWQDAHCGHFESAGKAQTRFLRENLCLQLAKCNTDQNNGRAIQYRMGKEINKRYGEGTAERISEKANTNGSLSEEELLEIISKYKAMLEELKQPNPAS